MEGIKTKHQPAHKQAKRSFIQKFFCILLLILGGWMSGSGQNYVRLADQSGINISESDILLAENASIMLKNAIPEEHRNQFAVYDFGFYLHNTTMLGVSSLEIIWENLIEELNSNIDKPYYLIFGRFYQQNNKPTLKIGLNLPSSGLTSCNTEVFRRSLSSSMNAMSNEMLGTNKEVFKVIEQMILQCKDKITKIIECCDTANRNSGEECSICLISKDEAVSDLAAEGYFDLTEIIDLCDNKSYTINISEKNYTKISSSYQIKFIHNEFKYNFTDSMDEYLTGTTNYDITVQVFDDRIQTTSVGCYEESSETAGKGRSNVDNKQTVVVLDYNNQPKVMVKLKMQRKPCDPLPVYLYDKINDENDLSIYTTSQINSFMNIAFNHSKHIYDKNGYYDLFSYHKLKTQAELEALVMDDFNSIYFFRNKNCNFHGRPGQTQFEEYSGFSLNLNKSSCKICESAYGNTINLAYHDILGQSFQLGYTLAHELLHVLTVRGARIMRIPQKDFCNKVHITSCNGGHLDDVPNLLRRGELTGDAPKASPILHPVEKIDPRAEYLMLHYLFKKVY